MRVMQIFYILFIYVFFYFSFTFKIKGALPLSSLNSSQPRDCKRVSLPLSLVLEIPHKYLILRLKRKGFLFRIRKESMQANQTIKSESPVFLIIFTANSLSILTYGLHLFLVSLESTNNKPSGSPYLLFIILFEFI